MKRPSFQFYPGDYMKDPALRACGMAARGMWVDCLCIMHESPIYGHLTLDGKSPVQMVNLARMTGITLVEAEGYMDELYRNGVSTKNEAGIIFSKRMVRDEYLRNIRAQGGKLGGNPALLNKPKVSRKVVTPGNLQPTPSSSSSSSTSVVSTVDEPPKVNQKFVKPTLEEIKGAILKAGLPESEAQRFLNHYESNGWKVGKNAMRSWTHAVGNWAIGFRSRYQSSPAGPPDRAKSLLEKLVDEI